MGRTFKPLGYRGKRGRAPRKPAAAKLATEAKQKPPPAPPPTQTSRRIKSKSSASDAGREGEYPQSKRSRQSVYINTTPTSNDGKTLAKVIKEIEDPEMKKFLSHCLIQYNRGELFKSI